jgi:oligopeptide transport system permease protein
MTTLIVRRLLLLPLIILIVYALTFGLAWLVPVNPLQNPEGRRPPPEVEAAMRSQYRLDDPAGFFIDYLGKASGVSWALGLHPRPFDLGPSLRHPDWTVNEILAAGLPVSMTLGLAAMALALLIGIAAGVIGGLRPGSGADLATLLVALIGVSLPSFVVGAALLVCFAVLLPLFPVGGWGNLDHMALPVVTLSLPFAAYIARLTRMGMIEQMRSDYVRTALAKGLSRRQAALRHALRNALLPVVSYLGPATAAALTGSFVVEKVFAVPGVGRHFVDAVLSKDLTLIMGVVLVYSTLLVLLNLAVDVAYRLVDPRIA